MDHYKIGEGGRTDRLPRKALICASGVDFPIDAPLPGGTWQATLRVHALRNGLQGSDRRGIVKKHVKRGSSRAWSYIEGVLGGSCSISRFKQRKIQ